MTIDQLGSFGELVGAIATVATLLYLAVQIRENTSWMKRQALESVVDRLANWSSRLRDNPEALNIYLRGYDDFNSLEEAEKRSYHFTMFEMLAAIETSIEHGKNDSIKSESIESGDRWIRRELGGAGAKVWWAKMGREQFARDFVVKVDGLVKPNDA